MKQRELELFLQLCKSLSFARTSAANHLAPSSLSRVIRRMEQELGTSLFERDSRKVKLTRAGQAFMVYAEQSCRSWAEFKRSIRGEEVLLRGELSLFCSVTASYSFLDDILGQFRQQYPAIEIKVHTGDSAVTLDRLSAESEDLGIAALPEKVPPQFAVLELSNSPLVFIGPNKGALAGNWLKQKGFTRWNETPLILSEKGLVRNRVDRWFRSMQIKPYVYAQVAGHEAIVSLVSLGFGIGVVPRIVLENSPFAARVKILEQAHSMAPITIGLCVLKRKLSNPLIAVFWQLATQSIANNMRL